ncbi:hypothetical protein HDU99_007404, partial [Rhizoclosmatium hyalinum]
MLQTRLPLENIQQIFSWIDPRYARRYRELCQKVNQALEDDHFARLNLQRFINLTHLPHPMYHSDIQRKAAWEREFGITCEPQAVSENPDQLDQFYFAFPSDYRRAYAQMKFTQITVMNWNRDVGWKY